MAININLKKTYFNIIYRFNVNNEKFSMPLYYENLNPYGEQIKHKEDLEELKAIVNERFYGGK